MNNLILTIVIALLSAAGNSDSYKLIKTLAIGGEGRWDYVSVDTDAHRLYVPRSDHVQVIDTGTETVVADWPGTSGVHGVAPVTRPAQGVPWPRPR